MDVDIDPKRRCRRSSTVQILDHGTIEEHKDSSAQMRLEQD